MVNRNLFVIALSLAWYTDTTKLTAERRAFRSSLWALAFKNVLLLCENLPLFLGDNRAVHDDWKAITSPLKVSQ